MKIIDAHPHIYSNNLVKYPSISDPWNPGEPATAEDLLATMKKNNIQKAVFIQTGTYYGFDNKYIMDSSKKFSEWATGVVTLSPDDKTSTDILENAVKNFNVKGLRGIPNKSRKLRDSNVINLWRKAEALEITVNCMVMDDLDLVNEIIYLGNKFSTLRIVIDHCLMLNTFRKTENTLNELKKLSKLPNIYAKLTSGTHGSPRIFPHEDMHDPLKKVIDLFSPERCLWGSNFPNKLWSKGTTYKENLSLFTKELGLSNYEKNSILYKTSKSLWF